MTPDAKTQLAKRLAREVGFDQVGVAPAAPLPGIEYYREWLAAGYAGTMSYLARNVDCRDDPRRLLPGAVSVICVAVNYRRADGYVRPSELAARDAVRASQAAEGRIAQYARGRDYHKVIRKMLRRLVARLTVDLGEPFASRICVDSAPVLERELAARAGLGWIGRNTCLLNAEFGSYLLLGELITSLDLCADEPVAERCGTCRRCLDACPTGALLSPGRLDATRCVSYLTIEHREAIDRKLWTGMGDHVFGCDVCQQVCPYNARAPFGTNADLLADILPERANLLSLMHMRDAELHGAFEGTAGARAKPWMWRRNGALVLWNGGVRDDGVQAAAASSGPDARA